MQELIAKTLSEIVNEQFKSAYVFEKYNLNYCCKGRRSLQQACEEENVSVTTIVDDLKNIYTNSSSALDFNSISLCQLSEYLVYTHHSFIKKEMPLILSYLEKVSSKHGKLHHELYEISELFVDLSNEMMHHMQKEENILFPRIQQLEQNGFAPIPLDIKYYKYLQIPIIDMKDDDEDADNKMAQIRKLTNNYTPPRESCTTFKLLYASLQAFEVDLHQYIHLENNVLFPKALVLEKEIQNTFHN